MARYIGRGLSAVPARRHQALPEGRPLLHREVRRRAPRLSAGTARPGPHALLGLRRAAAREAEGEAHVRRSLEQQFAATMDAALAHEGRAGREPARAARAPARQRRVPARLRDLARRGAPAGAPRPLPGERPQDQTFRRCSREGGRRASRVARGVARGRAHRRARSRRSRAAACRAGSSIEKAAFTGVVKALPARDDITMPIQEQLIVELYSR